MKIGFDNIRDHVIPLENFILSWRFTDEQYDRLPDIHLAQIKPLDQKASLFLWNYISDTGLHNDIPFKTNLFSTIDKAYFSGENQKEVKKWLYQRGISFDKEVFLSYQPDTAIMVPWKILIKYFDSFYYSDDLSVIDESLSWALLFYHEDEIYFGTNKKFEPSVTFQDIDFLW